MRKKNLEALLELLDWRIQSLKIYTTNILVKAIARDLTARDFAIATVLKHIGFVNRDMPDLRM